jgi:uncharacterized protein (TIGR02996 family)
MHSAASLYADVYANPDDDGPRSVLADMLQLAGDERGEFIALQLARGRGGKRSRRETELLKANQRLWLGPISPAIPNQGLVYERGFVAKCQLQHHRDAVLPFMSYPEWGTVEEITTGRWSGSLQPLADGVPALRVLKSEVNAGLLPSHGRLETIEIKYVFEDRDHEHLASLALPSLRQLDIAHCYATLPKLRPFLDGATSLKRLSLDVKDLAAWIPWLAQRGYERAGVRESLNPWMLWFEGDRITAEYRYSGHEQPNASAQLVEILSHVPSPKQWHVLVTKLTEWTGTSVVTVKQQTEAAGQRFASYVVGTKWA